MSTHYDICNALNQHYFSSLNPNMQNFINYITGGITENPLIECSVLESNLVKPNLDIVINSNHYFISVLNGQGNSVHEEQPVDIENFLIDLNAPDDVISFIHDLCYSENHTSGFIESETVTNPVRLANTRNFFNDNREVFIDRALRTGIHGFQESQFIYWGDITYGHFRDINTVINTLYSNTATTSLIAIGGLVIQRKDRFVNNNIQIKWPHPDQDL